MNARTKLSPEDEQLFSTVRMRATSLRVGAPYISDAIFNLLPVTTPGLRTMGVDKFWRVYIDFDYLRRRGVEWGAGALVHEAWHVLRRHHGRGANIPDVVHKDYNVAGDLEINDDIVEILKDTGGLQPEQFGFPTGESLEWYYAKLREERERNVKPSISVSPSEVRSGYTAPLALRASSRRTKFSRPIAKAITVTAADGTEITLTTPPTITVEGVSIVVDEVLPVGEYTVTASTEAGPLSTTFTVEDPSARLLPARLAHSRSTGPVVVVGRLTTFDASSRVELLDESGAVVERGVFSSPTLAAVVVGEELPDGTYTVRVTTGTEVVEAELPVGLPYAVLRPGGVIADYARFAPLDLDLDVEDITLDAGTTFTLVNGETGADVTHVLDTFRVDSESEASTKLRAGLAEGAYALVVSTPSSGLTAVAPFTVGGEGSGSGEGEGEGESGDSEGEGNPSSGGGKSDDFGGDCGSGAGGERKEHELAEGEAPAKSTAESEIIRRQVAQKILQEEQRSNGRGSSPSGAVRWAAEVLESDPVPWESVLQSKLKTIIATKRGQTDYDRRRPARRQVNPEILSPALRSPLVEIALGVDTSGSVEAAGLGVVLKEVDALIQKTGISGRNFRAFGVDAAAGAVTYVRRAADISLEGGGGTDMRVAVDAMNEMRPRVNIGIVATDGETPWPTEPPTSGMTLVILVIVPRRTPEAHSRALIEACPEWSVPILVEYEAASGRS